MQLHSGALARKECSIQTTIRQVNISNRDRPGQTSNFPRLKRHFGQGDVQQTFARIIWTILIRLVLSFPPGGSGHEVYEISHLLQMASSRSSKRDDIQIPGSKYIYNSRFVNISIPKSRFQLEM
jgi:hypothetical protein